MQPWEPGFCNTWLEREKQRDPGFSSGDRGADFFPKQAEMPAGQGASYAMSPLKEKSNGGWWGQRYVPKEILASVPNARYMHCQG